MKTNNNNAQRPRRLTNKTKPETIKAITAKIINEKTTATNKSNTLPFIFLKILSLFHFYDHKGMYIIFNTQIFFHKYSLFYPSILFYTYY